MVSKFSFLFIFISLGNSFACDLNQKVVSLSGPITMLLEEMNLLESDKLMAISSFHPIRKDSSAEVLLGGLFIAKKSLYKFKDSVFFYDQSRELRKILENSKLEKIQDISARGKSAIEVTKISIDAIKPYLKDCEEQLLAVEKKLTRLKGKLSSGKSAKLIFFLGEISNKFPSYVITNDGFVLDLLKSKKIKTYESELAFVLWSEKLLSKYKSYIKIGVFEKKDSNSLTVEKISDKRFNISYPGILTPGISQINFLELFTETPSFFLGRK